MIKNKILSNGVDIVDIKRIRKILGSGNKAGFLSKVFTDMEKTYFAKNSYNIETIAGYFAVKEAVMKTLGEGMNKISFKDIEVRKDGRNNPYLYLTGEAKVISDAKGIDHFEISIAHEKEYAVAFVIGVI